jgi:uncharacterized protein (DUF4415 family)
MNIVRLKKSEIPPISKERLAELEVICKKPGSEIDFSDQPELADEELAEFKPLAFYWSAKTEAMIHLDSDVLAWIKKHNQDCQAYANAMLREAMLREQQQA